MRCSKQRSIRGSCGRLAAFHKVMWKEIGVYNDHTLWDQLTERQPLLDSDATWECYGGWLIAQGRACFERVRHDHAFAVAHMPPVDDVFAGESVIFVAQRVCLKKTGGKWYLNDLFGDSLDGSP